MSVEYIKALLPLPASSGALAGEPLLALLLSHVDERLLTLSTLRLSQQTALLLRTRALDRLSLVTGEQSPVRAINRVTFFLPVPEEKLDYNHNEHCHKDDEASKHHEGAREGLETGVIDEGVEGMGEEVDEAGDEGETREYSSDLRALDRLTQQGSREGILGVAEWNEENTFNKSLSILLISILHRSLDSLD